MLIRIICIYFVWSVTPPSVRYIHIQLALSCASIISQTNIKVFIIERQSQSRKVNNVHKQIIFYLFLYIQLFHFNHFLRVT